MDAETSAPTEEALQEDAQLAEVEETIDFPPYDATLPVSSFGETWGYVIAGEEAALKASYPLSDVGYFGAEIDSYGKLTEVPDRRKLAFYSGRVHLVVACNGRALTHFALEPGSATRRQLITDLLEAARAYDGLQIDFELVPARDGEPFRSFLGELRERLRGKPLTVALPARTKTTIDNWYHYAAIKPLVDRILLMAYDEHWSTSAPGPIASMGWCKTVAAYGLATIGPEKLIMGVPFYGRTWGSVKLYNWNRAFYYTGIERIKRENNVTEVRRVGGIPTFTFIYTYQVPMTVTGYYEDDYSLATRLEMYRTMGVASVGFWRIGQETPAVWKLLKLDAGK
ncbi:hypothetical protein FACS1894130_00640 [Spirochaetia bacterium]|nr:hypothetical protein FACS1894130_00640 [Spirochaetia bacterium]